MCSKDYNNGSLMAVAGSAITSHFVEIQAKSHSETNLDNLLNVSGHLVLMTTQRKIFKESMNQLRLK